MINDLLKCLKYKDTTNQMISSHGSMVMSFNNNNNQVMLTNILLLLCKLNVQYVSNKTNISNWEEENHLTFLSLETAFTLAVLTFYFAW